MSMHNNNITNLDHVTNTSKIKYINILRIFIVIVVVAEISFLGRLHFLEHASLVNSLTDSFRRFSTSYGYHGEEYNGEVYNSEELECMEWLEKEDMVEYSRDFHEDPIVVAGLEKNYKTCGVGCTFVETPGMKADAGFRLQGGVLHVIRSMESANYFPSNRIDSASRKWYNHILMTTSLSSDVPAGYFSWTEYDIMAPVKPKTEKALAAAFISNCQAMNIRLQALGALEKNVMIDSYGTCHNNRNGDVDKIETLRRYKFSLAFENSNEEDYVTEKFFQSLVAGSVPVVIGAPNIEDFAPAPGSLLHIKDLDDVSEVSKTMKYLAENPIAYNKTLRWKYEGPSDSFKALLDMAVVHSSCRLCIFLATKFREKEEEDPKFKQRPCLCARGPRTVYHLYVRERGRFDMTSIFLRSDNLTMEALESAVLLKFNSMNHVPIWKDKRPESIRGDGLKVYRIYPVNMTQREALYTFKFQSNTEFEKHIKENPCTKFEVIFV